jgi:hypothetical protein
VKPVGDARHGGNVQVITAPDGWPIWTSKVRPGREHDTTALRAHGEILPALAEAADDLLTLGDLGYEADTITVTLKKPKHGEPPTSTRPSTPPTTGSVLSANAATAS